MKNRITNLIKLLIGWPLSLLAIFFIGKLVVNNIKNVSQAFTHIQPVFLILGVCSLLCYFFFRALAWYFLLQTHKHHFSFTKTTFYWSFSEIRRYIPGNVWSFLSRAHYFETEKHTKKDILTLHITETLFLLLSAGGVSLCCLNLLLSNIRIPGKEIFIPVIGVFLFFALCVVLFGKAKSFMPKRMQILLTLLSLEKRIELFLLMSVAWICFGLGTYWTIIAVWYLPLQHVLSFIGFFSFAFLVGYLSFITPMGLGIREGVMTAGLTPFIRIAQAAGVSLFSRIFLILAELIFLCFSYLAMRFEQYTEQGIIWIKKHKYTTLLTLGITLYIIYFTAASFLRYSNFYTGRFDLGNMDQTVWNTLHGRIFELTDPDGTRIISRLSVHADFILVLLAPFYMLWQDPRMLLFIQSVILGLGAVFVYLLGRKLIQDKRFSLIFAFAYLCNPALGYTNLYDFHPVVLATTFLLGAFYFMREKKYLLFFLFAILAALTKEEIWTTVGLFGIYITLVQKKWWWGIPLVGFGFTITYGLIAVLIPHVKGSEHFALSFYSDFGSSPLSILKTIFFSPQKTLFTILKPNKLFYLLQLFSPLGFTSLINPLSLFFALPDLVVDLLSNNEQFSQIYYQYTAAITPFLFIASLYSVAYMKKRWKKVSLTILSYYLVATTLITAYFFGPLPGALHANIAMFTDTVPNAEVISNFLHDIPKSFSVAASNNLGSHLSHRQKIYTIPNGMDQADVIAFLLNDQYAQPSLAAQKQMVVDLKRDKRYIEIFKLDDFVVFEKRNLYMQPEPRLGKIRLFPLSIPALQDRDYVGGDIKLKQILAKTETVNTYLITYPSDGLMVSAEIYLPNQPKPKNGFPTVILNRGYIAPEKYQVTSAYNAISNEFAEEGFAVIKPEYRGTGNSEKDASVSGILSYPIDVLNLVSSLQSLPEVDAKNIFLWGHSTGGGVVLTTLEAHDSNKNFSIPFRAAAVWAPVTDPFSAYQTFSRLLVSGAIPYSDTVKTLGTPIHDPLIWQSVSPIFYLDDLRTPLTITQGVADTVIPYQETTELFNDLKSLNKTAQFNLYQDGDHTLSNETEIAVKSDVTFFKAHLLRH